MNPFSATRTSARILLVGLVAAATALSVIPLAAAQQSTTTGRTLTDFVRTLSLDGADASLGQLVAVDLTLTAELDSRVLEITNNSGSAADFAVTTNVQFCGSVGTAIVSYASCSASASPTLNFTTTTLAESFVNLVPGETQASSDSVRTVDVSSLRVLDPVGLGQFLTGGPIEIGVATLAGFEALGGGGNSLVEIETFASVSADITYVYAGVSIVKLTNGADGPTVVIGEPVVWTYDVTNDGNTALQNLVVTDDKEGSICVIALLEAGATTQCTANGVAGSLNYQNVATVVGEPVINPGVTVEAEDPSSYVAVSPPPPTPTPAAPTPIPRLPVPTVVLPTPTPTVPSGGFTEPEIDIELSTNGVDADLAPGVSLDISQPITWSYVVTNTGVVDLYEVTVSDDRAGGVCVAPYVPAGGATVCTLEGQAAAGDFRRVGDVVGYSLVGQRVTDVDPTHHHAKDEVLGKVVTPPPITERRDPGGPVPVSTTPDEVLARTGTDVDVRTKLGGMFLGVGGSLLALSTGLRRKRIADQISVNPQPE